MQKEIKNETFSYRCACSDYHGPGDAGLWP
jgi:hypothetical protein